VPPPAGGARRARRRSPAILGLLRSSPAQFRGRPNAGPGLNNRRLTLADPTTTAPTTNMATLPTRARTAATICMPPRAPQSGPPAGPLSLRPLRPRAAGRSPRPVASQPEEKPVHPPADPLRSSPTRGSLGDGPRSGRWSPGPNLAVRPPPTTRVPAGTGIPPFLDTAPPADVDAMPQANLAYPSPRFYGEKARTVMPGPETGP